MRGEMLIALVECPALEECRNLISTFSETGFSGCANTTALRAMQSKPSVVQQKPPQNPNLQAHASNLALVPLLSRDLGVLGCPGQERRGWWGGAAAGGWHFVAVLPSWWDAVVSHPGRGGWSGVLGWRSVDPERSQDSEMGSEWYLMACLRFEMLRPELESASYLSAGLIRIRPIFLQKLVWCRNTCLLRDEFKLWEIPQTCLSGT